MSLVIRRFRAADAPALKRLNDVYGPPTVKAKDFIVYCLGPKRLHTAWLAVQDGKPVGFAITGDWVSFGGNGVVCKLFHLFVLEAQRGQGVGWALLQRVKEDAAKRGCKRLDTGANTDNRSARRLYEKFGFKPKIQAQVGYQLSLA